MYSIKLFFQIIHVLLLAGDTVQVVYRAGSDTTPVWATTTYYVDGFTGFRIWLNFQIDVGIKVLTI